jgi:hypothetical protein
MEDTATATVPSAIKASIKEFLRLDDGLKQARLDMKESRAVLNEHKEKIIDFMRESDVPKLSARKGEATLMLQEKEVKIRADADVVKNKLQELLAKGVTDPQTIYEEINKCGGVRTEWRLARRSKRKPSDKPKQPKAKKQRTASASIDD